MAAILPLSAFPIIGREMQERYEELYHAVDADNGDEVIRLHRIYGFDLNATLYERSLLWKCIREGLEDAGCALISLGANVNLEEEGETPLEAAVKNRWMSLALALYMEDTEKRVLGRSRSSILHVAAAANNLGFLQFLLEKGWDPDTRDGVGRTPLMEAARYDSTHCYEELIRWGADRNPMDDRGQTLICYCFRQIFSLSTPMEDPKVCVSAAKFAIIKDVIKNNYNVDRLIGFCQNYLRSEGSAPVARGPSIGSQPVLIEGSIEYDLSPLYFLLTERIRASFERIVAAAQSELDALPAFGFAAHHPLTAQTDAYLSDIIRENDPEKAPQIAGEVLSLISTSVAWAKRAPAVSAYVATTEW